MLPILIDEGLPAAVAFAPSAVGVDAVAVGMPDAPPRGSDDEANCRWAAERGAVLVTNDRGRKDRAILDLLAQHHVHAIFVGIDLRGRPARELLRALLLAEPKIDQLAGKRQGLIHHRLRPSGGLEARR